MPSFTLNSLLHILQSTDGSSIRQFALSYTAFNLYTYFIIIPITWTLVLDRKLRTSYFITFAYCVLLCFAAIFGDQYKKHLFQAGVNFCVYMQKVHHCTYAESCIIWCVLMPLTVTIILISLPTRNRAYKTAFSRPA